MEVRGTTEVSLRFTDGCHASLWGGKKNGLNILWGVDTNTDEVSIFKMQDKS